MPPSSRQLEVELLRHTFGGSSMGRLPDGRAVFVPYALPGERVWVELIEEKRGFARARLVEVLKASPQRIIPRCRHFGVCGGCHYQHLPYAEQLRVKSEVLREQLERIGGIGAPPLEAIQPSPREWHYRNTVQFHLDERGRLGYEAMGSNQVVAIEECFLPQPPLDEIWRQLDFEAGLGIERVGLRVGLDEEVLLTLEGQATELPALEVDLPISAVHLSPAGSLVLAGEDWLPMEVNGRLFRVSAESFFQINTAQAGAMVEYLQEALPLDQQTTLLDVYCGVGLFSAFLAERVARCIGVEVSPSACEDYAVNLDEYDHVELYMGAAEEVLAGLRLSGRLVVVLDPPRAGLDRRALDALVALQPEWIAYVSCDPATLARDLKRLVEQGYRLERIKPFDLFPQTYHIESISLLQRTD
ncbi:MAG: 23S rRNA (uracil-5-)-methyltransferase RumA [Bellilinea sp.]|nr:MAG: 23S rRNA (uracil-5-)-methyltransferase RumA [Bellilinea sp.]